ncbi:MAG TPA: phosphatase PAP2 family protein [Actinomycetota bacterium]|nr:phosphatase PAP2 family protein [Actinomycetota bacterium]
MNPRGLFRGLGLLGGALAVGAWASDARARLLDRKGFRALNRDRGPEADAAFRGITELGSIWASVGAATVVAAAGRRRAAARALGAAGLAWVAGQGLKRVFGRPRPYEVDPDGTRLLIGPPRASSWPSSHPAVLLAFVTVAGRELRIGAVGRAGLTALAAAVGASRTYVDVHHPSDVVGGLLLGRACAALLAGPARLLA